MLRHADLTRDIIGAAIEVHKVLGPGLLESAYQQCMCRELALREMKFRREVELPVEYKGFKLDCGYRLDLLVEGTAVVEIKAIAELLSIHEAQLLTYMRLSHCSIGLLINFHATVLKDGIIRRVL